MRPGNYLAYRNQNEIQPDFQAVQVVTWGKLYHKGVRSLKYSSSDFVVAAAVVASQIPLSRLGDKAIDALGGLQWLEALGEICAPMIDASMLYAADLGKIALWKVRGRNTEVAERGMSRTLQNCVFYGVCIGGVLLIFQANAESIFLNVFGLDPKAAEIGGNMALCSILSSFSYQIAGPLINFGTVVGAGLPLMFVKLGSTLWIAGGFLFKDVTPSWWMSAEYATTALGSLAVLAWMTRRSYRILNFKYQDACCFLSATVLKEMAIENRWFALLNLLRYFGPMIVLFFDRTYATELSIFFGWQIGTYYICNSLGTSACAVMCEEEIETFRAAYGAGGLGLTKVQLEANLRTNQKWNISLHVFLSFTVTSPINVFLVIPNGSGRELLINLMIYYAAALGTEEMRLASLTLLMLLPICLLQNPSENLSGALRSYHRSDLAVLSVAVGVIGNIVFVAVANTQDAPPYILICGLGVMYLLQTGLMSFFTARVINNYELTVPEEAVDAFLEEEEEEPVETVALLPDHSVNRVVEDSDAEALFADNRPKKCCCPGPSALLSKLKACLFGRSQSEETQTYSASATRRNYY